jgi:di/tricarboxylate transporter
MDAHAWIAVATLVVAMVLFITKLIPLEATALSIPVVLAVTGTIEPAGAALKGFGNSAVIALGAIFVLSAGLQESGVATVMGRVLQRLGGKSEWRLVLLIMITTCVLSAIMSNAATVAVFLPAVIVLSRSAKIPASRLMMPLGYAAIVGGTLTLISTTPNLILGSELQRLSGGGRSLGMFEFALVGVPIAVVCVAYMALVGTRLLGKGAGSGSAEKAGFRARVMGSYRIRKGLYRIEIPRGASLVGKTVGESEIGRKYELEVVQVHRSGALRNKYLDAVPDLVLTAGDHLFVEGTAENAKHFAKDESLTFAVAGRAALDRLLGRGINIAEVTLSPHSACIGQSLKGIGFRGRSGLTVLAIWRRGEAIEKGIADVVLELGDALLAYGPVRNLRKLGEDEDFVVLEQRAGDEDVRRAPLALLILAAALIPPVFGWFPLAVSALGAALLMVGTGCVSLRGAQRSIDYRILFLIIGTVPLGDALFQTGVAGKMAEALFPSGSDLSGLYVCGVLFAVSAILSVTSNNAAAAVILAPVAYAAAQSSGVDVGKTFLAVAYGASCAFVLPFAHQCNLMVMGPGGYRTRDFAKVGIGMSIVMAITAVTLLAVL